MSQNKAALLLIIAVQLLPTAARRRPRIFHGTKVTEGDVKARGQFGFIVSIQVCRTVECKTCTGSLVSPSRILTANSCFCGMEARSRNVYFHALHRGYGKLVEVDDVKASNKACDEGIENDYAIIFLKENMTDITPVPVSCVLLVENQKFTVLGFGFDQKDRFGRLSEITTPATRLCSEKHNDFSFCYYAESHVSRPGDGDEGSPALIHHNGQWVLVGIYSKETKIAQEESGERGNLIYMTTPRNRCIGELWDSVSIFHDVDEF